MLEGSRVTVVTQVVSSMSGHRLVKKIKKALHNAKLDDNNIDFGALEANLGCDDNDKDNDEDNDNNAALEAADYSVGDTIGKSLVLIK